VIAPVAGATWAAPQIETLGAAVDQEGGHPLAWALGGFVEARGGEDDGEIGEGVAADEVLGAVDEVIVAVAFRSGGHRHDVRARPRLGERKALVALAAHARQQVALALVAVAGEQNLRRPPDEVLQGEARLREFPLHQGETGVTEAAAAHLFRKVGGERRCRSSANGSAAMP